MKSEDELNLDFLLSIKNNQSNPDFLLLAKHNQVRTRAKVLFKRSMHKLMYGFLMLRFYPTLILGVDEKVMEVLKSMEYKSSKHQLIMFTAILANVDFYIKLYQDLLIARSEDGLAESLPAIDAAPNVDNEHQYKEN